MNKFKYYLGTHEPSWLYKTDIPLFISINRLQKARNHRKATTEWALDSGAFTELSTHGTWRMSPVEYASKVELYSESIGNMNWASIQDYLCAPAVLNMTGMTIKQHQTKTLESFLELRNIKPDIRWIPILQGWSFESYLDHLDLYASYGIELHKQPLVGVGSLANRQSSPIVSRILMELHNKNINIHAFGLSKIGLLNNHTVLASSDSMVWSFIARQRKIKLKECNAKHKICNNCILFAKSWYNEVLNTLRSSDSAKS